MNAAFRRILLISGSALVLQGLLDLVAGPWLHVFSTMGEAVAAGADSDARFLGGMLLAVGVTFVLVSRSTVLPMLTVRLLAAGMTVGAVGRLASLAIAGPGSTLSVVLIAVEIASSAAVLVLSLLAARESAAVASATSAAASVTPADAPIERELAALAH